MVAQVAADLFDADLSQSGRVEYMSSSSRSAQRRGHLAGTSIRGTDAHLCPQAQHEWRPNQQKIKRVKNHG
jgi:hypothetical protein